MDVVNNITSAVSVRDIASEISNSAETQQQILRLDDAIETSNAHITRTVLYNVWVDKNFISKYIC